MSEAERRKSGGQATPNKDDEDMNREEEKESEDKPQIPTVRVTRTERLSGIEIGKKKVGDIYKLHMEDGSTDEVYVTERNKHLILKETGHTIGISEATLNRVSLHKVKRDIIKYKCEDGHYEYYDTTHDDWENAIPYFYGADKQWHIPITELKKKQVLIEAV